MALSKDVDMTARNFVTSGLGKDLDRFERPAFLGLSDDEVTFFMQNYQKLNGSIKKYLGETNPAKRVDLFKEMQAVISAPEKPILPSSTPVVETQTKPEPMKKDIKADPKTRRLLINLIGNLYEVQPENGGNLTTMLSKARERHNAFSEKASAFLGHIAPGSTVVKATVEGHGTVRFFANLFGVQQPLEPIDGSSELAALTTVWIHAYKKEWAGTNPEMTDEERTKRFEEKKTRILQKTNDDIANFGGYENTEELLAEITTALPDAVHLLQEHITAP